MEWYIQGLLLATGLVVLMLSGLNIAFSMGVVSTVALILAKGLREATNVLGLWMTVPTEQFVFLCLPLFILMSELVAVSGISSDLFDSMNKWFGRLPGALANVSNVSAGVFAAICGSSVATSATIGTVALPQMMTRGYNKRLAVGAIAVGGTLGILIPPSMAMVLYCVVVDESVGRMFIAGVIPGIISVLVYSAAIVVYCSLNPTLAPRGENFPWKARLRSLAKIFPILVLVMAVLGTIYLGVCTPTEAAAAGAFGALCIGVAYRRLNLSKLHHAMLETVRTTSFVLLICIAALYFAYVLTSLNITTSLVELIAELGVSRWAILAMVVVLLLVLGCFLDVASMLFITMPVLHPVVTAAGFDSVHFGIIVVILSEIALLTPPVGMNAFVTHGIAERYGVTLDDVFIGVMYFLPLDIVILLLVIMFPQLSLWLPSKMF